MSGSRRLVAWTSTCVVIASAMLATICANLLADATRTRFDLTVTGQHKLSPRLGELIERLPGRFELVLAVDSARVDRASLDAVVDLFSTLSSKGQTIGFRLLDVGSARGREQFDDIVRQLRERDRPIIEQQAARLLESAARFREHTTELESASSALESLSGSVPEGRSDVAAIRRLMQGGASLARLGASDIGTLAGLIEQGTLVEGETLPDTGAVRDRLAGELERLETQMSTLGTELGRFASTDTMPPDMREQVAPISRTVLRIRDALASDYDELQRLSRPAVFRVASAIEQGEALLVIGPAEVGITAVARDALLPSVDALQSAGIGIGGEIARRAEDLLTTALVSLSSPHQPIVVMVHAEVEPFILNSPAFEQFVDRVRSRGMELLEWAVVRSSAHPSLEAVDPNALRPVVYVVISPNSAASSQDSDPERSGGRRAARLGALMAELIAQGESVLVSLNPSVFPTFGDIDPIAGALAPFGLVAQTGLAIVTEEATEQGKAIRTSATAVGSGGEHPLQRALTSLPTQLLWPIAVDAQPTPGVETIELLTLAGASGRWMESQWMGLWQAQTSAADATAQFDAGRDERRDAYTLAVAAERLLDGQPQRVVCIGSNGWALDRVAQPRRAVDGRLVAVNPGNLELGDAAIAWLAFMDDAIARSAASGNVATIRAMSASEAARVRWLLLAALPLGTLILGALWRVMRG